jgi:hypothetical protein
MRWSLAGGGQTIAASKATNAVPTCCAMTAMEILLDSTAPARTGMAAHRCALVRLFLSIDRDRWANADLTRADTATSAGTLLVDCGMNMYCCGAVEESCCDDESQHFFVDPLNGDVKHPSKATGSSASASPTWWTVDSKALLAATSTSSASSASSATSTSVSASTTGSMSASTTSSSSSTPTNTSPPQEEGSKGISAGAGAGIGIGAAAGVVLVAGLVWWLLKRRKSKNAYAAPAELPHDGAYGSAAYPSEPKHSGYYAHTGTQPGQGPTQYAPQELDGSNGMAEVHGESSRA